MDAAELLRIVDSIYREKKIPKEIIIAGIESGLLTAAKKYYGDDCDVRVHIDPVSGQISASHNGIPMPAEEISQRIGAQTAKQVMIQKIREAERDMLYDEYKSQIDEMVTGKVYKMERGTAIVQLGDIEAILPFNEMIPKESIRVGDQIRVTIAEVSNKGSRVKVILSRIRTHLVKRLFEENIPEIAEGVIEIKGISREPGYRSKVAVVSDDQRIDCVGSCVGVRGNRIKDIKSDLAGEQIDIVPWDPDPMKFIPNALQPATVEETILCPMLGRAIVLVKEDQLSLGIGKKGQNVRLASKLCGWDIEIMTAEELQETLDGAVLGFRSIPGVSDDLADMLVAEGFVSFDDLSIIEPDVLQEWGDLSPKEADAIIDEAERRAFELDRLKAQEKQEESQQKKDEAQKKYEQVQKQSSAEKQSRANSEQEKPASEQEKAASEQDKPKSKQDKPKSKSKQDKTKSEQDKVKSELEKAKSELEKTKSELEKAKSELEKVQIRKLALLKDRIKQIQELQDSIYDSTCLLDDELQKNGGQDAAGTLSGEAAQLSEYENDVLLKANNALLLLQEDGSETAVELTRVVENIQDVIELLDKADVGMRTQTLQENIVATLENLFEMVKRQLKDIEKKEQQSQNGESSRRRGDD